MFDTVDYFGAILVLLSVITDQCTERILHITRIHAPIERAIERAIERVRARGNRVTKRERERGREISI